MDRYLTERRLAYLRRIRWLEVVMDCCYIDRQRGSYSSYRNVISCIEDVQLVSLSVCEEWSKRTVKRRGHPHKIRIGL